MGIYRPRSRRQRGRSHDRFVAHCGARRIGTEHGNAALLRPFDLVWRNFVIGNDIEAEPKLLLIVEMRINVGLRRLLRVKVGARGIGGAVVELDDMFAGLTGGSKELSGRIVVVALDISKMPSG